MEKKNPCEDCGMRKKYDDKPKSLAGRFWRWHINFCPGWKSYMKSLEDDQVQEVAKKYNLKKYIKN